MKWKFAAWKYRADKFASGRFAGGGRSTDNVNVVYIAARMRLVRATVMVVKHI